MPTTMFEHLQQLLRSNVFYQKHLQSRVNDTRYAVRNWRMFRTLYHNTPSENPSVRHTLFFIIDPHQRHPGFADRLKVFCCIDYIAEQNGYDFKLVLDDDFPLERYLEPNETDWRGRHEMLSHSRKDVRLIAYNGGKADIPVLKKDICQYHIYNYIGLDVLRRTQGDQWRHAWNKQFHHLFRPTEYLNSLLSQYEDYPPKSYVAVHIRFVNALDQIEEGFYNKLDATGQQQLVENCLDALNYLQRNYQQPLLVFSDSERFLKIAHEHGYQRIEGGKVGHISFCSEAFEKTVLDFHMLSRASRIVRINSPLIYGSTFPIYASFMGNCPIFEYSLEEKTLTQLPF